MSPVLCLPQGSIGRLCASLLLSLIPSSNAVMLSPDAEPADRSAVRRHMPPSLWAARSPSALARVSITLIGPREQFAEDYTLTQGEQRQQTCWRRWCRCHVGADIGDNAISPGAGGSGTTDMDISTASSELNTDVYWCSLHRTSEASIC